MQYNFPKIRGFEGRLEFFRKSIRFGSAIRPSVRTVSVGWQSKIFKEGISGGFAFATCTWNVSSVMCPLHQSLVWGITQVRGLHMKYCKRGEEKLIAGQQFPSFRTCNSSKLTVRLRNVIFPRHLCMGWEITFKLKLLIQRRRRRGNKTKLAKIGLGLQGPRGWRGRPTGSQGVKEEAMGSHRINGDSWWVLWSFVRQYVQVFMRVQWGQASRGMFRGPKVVEGGHWGSCEVKRDVLGIPWSHPVGSMHLLMIQGI